MNREGQPGHIDHIKQANAGTVYRLIDMFGPISRISLSKISQLAPASITKIVRELQDAHLVKETEVSEPGSRGRPAVGVELDTHAWHYLGVRVHYGYLSLALQDLSNRLIIEEQIAFPVDKNAAPWLIRFIVEIEAFFERHQALLERLTAIAITVPGIIDTATGMVKKLPFYDEEHLPLAASLSKKTGLPVYVQQDIAAWAMSEALYGAAMNCQNVIQIAIDDTVGASVISGGRMLHADSSRRIEIGHTRVEANGKACYCGNSGCLETIISMGSILERTKSLLESHPESLLNFSSLSIDNLCRYANANDALAKEIVHHVGMHVGQIAAVMVNVFNPEKILIGSPLNKASAVLYPSIEEGIHRAAMPDYTHSLRIEPTRFMNVGTMPASALVKMALYDGSLLLGLLQG